MANIVFPQIRSIDAFSSYDSNIVNRLTRIVSLDDDILLSRDSLQVTNDSTSPTTVIITPGYVVKDDVFIQQTDDFNVDMTDPDFYTEATALDSTGIYYITLYYTYLKTKPPPEAKIRILKPDQHSNIDNDELMFLGAVEINDNYEIEAVYDYDPNDSSVGRPISSAGGGVLVVDTLPDWNLDLEGLLYYETSSGKFYGAGEDDWYELQVLKYTTITSDYEAHDNEVIFVNQSTDPLTIQLPGLPQEGSEVHIIDIGRLFGNYSVTIDGNGNNIIGSVDVETSLNYSQYKFIYSETKGEWFYSQSATSVSAGGATTAISTDYNAEIGDLIFVSDSTSSLTITLPPGPSSGDRIQVKDDGRLFQDYPITFDGNGNTISGSSALTSTSNYSKYEFVYSGSSGEWTYTQTLEEPLSKDVYQKITPTYMNLDDIDVGSDGGNLFGIIETVDFAANEDGTIWTVFKYETKNLSVDQPIYIDLHYSLNGDDPNKDVYLETSYWALDPSMSYDIDNPDSTAVQDVIVSDSTANIGIYVVETLTAEVDPMYLSSDTEFIVIKFTRSGSTDTYSGTFQLVALELYQKT